MNKAIIVGRLTKDIELQDTKNGTLCTRFTLAVPRKGKLAPHSPKAARCRDLFENRFGKTRRKNYIRNVLPNLIYPV